jgi:trigger factor
VKVKSDKVENRQAYLTIEMEPAEKEDYEEKAYKSLVKRVNIPGFRKGKAPRPTLERYVGKEKLTEEALNILIPEAYKKAVAQEKIEAFAQPTLEIEKTEPVVFKAVIPLAPIVNIGDYKAVRMQPEPVNVTDENINGAIEQLRHQYATWEPVERPVEYGDMVVMDVFSTIEGQTSIDRKGVQYQVTKDLPLPVPGFPAEMVGMKRDEEKEFKLKFPADYARPELANKEASFKVKILEIKQEKLPDVNEDFVKMVNPDFKTVEELRGAVEGDIKRQLEERARLDFEDKVTGKVLADSSVEFPPVMTQMESDNMIRVDMQRAQITDFQEYQNTVGKTEKQLREQLEPEAKQHVTRSLVLDRIAREEKLSVSHEEIDAEIENMVLSAEESRRKNLEDYLATDRAHETIESILLMRKTVQRLASIAKGSVEGVAESAAVSTEVEKKEEQK